MSQTPPEYSGVKVELLKGGTVGRITLNRAKKVQ